MTWQVAEANVIVLNLRRPSNTWHATKSSCLASIIKKKNCSTACGAKGCTVTLGSSRLHTDASRSVQLWLWENRKPSRASPGKN